MELKPCPFCNGESFIRKLYKNYMVDAKHDRNCPMANMPIPYDTGWVTQLAAEAAWNRRAADAIPVEWLEEHDSEGNEYGRRYITVVEALSMREKEQEANDG